jgi:hypothetical protein
MAIPAGAYMKIASDAQQGKLDGQVKSPPTYWVMTTQGMSGFFAVMMWDGMGFDEPWETGFGRYKKSSQAVAEAKQWAEVEGLEFRP